MYLDDWKAISARINGLMRSGELLAQFLQVNSAESYGAQPALKAQMVSTLRIISEFSKNHRAALAPDVIAIIENFGTSLSQYLTDSATNEMIRSCLIQFGAFESELSFLLKDTQAQIRARSERAFLHLQRSLVVDEVDL